MDKEHQSLVTRISPETPESPVTISYVPRNMNMFYVLDQELENIGSTSLQCSIWLALFGVAFGAMLTLWITISTVEIKSPYTYAAYWAGALVSSMGAVSFGILSVRDYLSARRHLAKVRNESANRSEPR